MGGNPCLNINAPYFSLPWPVPHTPDGGQALVGPDGFEVAEVNDALTINDDAGRRVSRSAHAEEEGNK